MISYPDATYKVTTERYKQVKQARTAILVENLFARSTTLGEKKQADKRNAHRLYGQAENLSSVEAPSCQPCIGALVEAAPQRCSICSPSGGDRPSRATFSRTALRTSVARRNASACTRYACPLFPASKLMNYRFPHFEQHLLAETRSLGTAHYSFYFIFENRSD